jgi:hypothetical protein
MIGTLGQFVREIRDKLAGVGDPIPVTGSFAAPVGGATEAKQDAQLAKMPDLVSGSVPVVTGLEIPEHDHISLSYTSGNLTGVTYRTGGSGGTVVATLTLAYDGSNNLLTVTKS